MHPKEYDEAMAILAKERYPASVWDDGDEIRIAQKLEKRYPEQILKYYKALIEADRVECMVALPGQLFTNTQDPACIWFLTRNKGERNGYRSRKGETLFIDTRNLGYMKDRVLRDFSPEDIAKIADTFRDWKKGAGYDDVAGLCKAASVEAIKKHDYVLTPGRYVGAPPQEDDGEPFEEKMARLTTTLYAQFAEGARLDAEIRRDLAGLGYEL